MDRLAVHLEGEHDLWLQAVARLVQAWLRQRRDGQAAAGAGDGGIR